jgi:hypothetical protein
MTWNARPQGRRGLAATAALLTALTVPAAAQRGPAPAKTNLPADVLSVACAPGIAFELPCASPVARMPPGVACGVPVT